MVEEAAPKGTTPPGATIVLAGHYGAHASMMGRFCPPGASSSDWTLEHDPSVHLRFVALTGDGGEWVVFRLAQKGGSTEHSVALVASIDAAVVATLAPHLVEKGAVNQLVVAVGASWAVATATLPAAACAPRRPWAGRSFVLALLHSPPQQNGVASFPHTERAKPTRRALMSKTTS